MTRLPTPGGDNGNWGDILNDYLSQAHNPNGSLKDNSIGSAQLQDNAVAAAQIADGAITNSLIADGTIAETKLSTAVTAKLNQAASTWTTISGKPTVIASGADQATARAVISAASQRIMRPNGPRLGVLGDSLQSFAYSSTSGSAVASHGGVIWRRVQMTNPQQDPGDTIDDVITTQLPALLASNPLPNACAIAIGRNDAGSGMTGSALATWMTKLDSICTQLVNAGIVPILETLMPTGAAGLPSSPQQ